MIEVHDLTLKRAVKCILIGVAGILLLPFMPLIMIGAFFADLLGLNAWVKGDRSDH